MTALPAQRTHKHSLTHPWAVSVESFVVTSHGKIHIHLALKAKLSNFRCSGKTQKWWKDKLNKYDFVWKKIFFGLLFGNKQGLLFIIESSQCFHCYCNHWHITSPPLHTHTHTHTQTHTQPPLGHCTGRGVEFFHLEWTERKDLSLA